MEVGKVVSPVVLMEVTQVGVRTRARAMAIVEEEIADNSVAVKRRKLGNDKLRSPSSTFVETKVVDREICVNNVLKDIQNDCYDGAVSCRSSGVSASCCSSSTGSMEKPKVSDLEESVDQTGTTTTYKLDGRKSTLGELESTAADNRSTTVNNSSHTVLPAEKMAPEAELEEFFVAAQEGLNERFKNKYNYDIVNDIPLKGRFEWIQVNPTNNKDDDDGKEDD
ncbi:putative cyclin-dependent kinase inhibitor [Helianthus annuus]|uniref:Cyclin-dependent kinase inhibitor n=1 Tax=Helianthus annuus TaxID=4232 RepID=A0A251SJ78_HELAN|nr:cyclin-dependent kinase inhibitor 7 [Helianthus annuus]KAF5769721.1 putative cyclin-dependent kinase inhibitor [Helianthus annuus]KAJ0464691.1 putative cyclin-dependent kinase inhibitor domain-containing protein [Helianthus annuus]KAJ0486288.1 putative cyclin-dependent kinase inhibitor domain-containing protein [Helianthus annuus]KAJ0656840.1 putative cyclin-dependent kinase inhibitor domain-containing protein [Helianthus annuus]KAJ0660438.1 putative cyclin-dependent kinase inhibitor domain